MLNWRKIDEQNEQMVWDACLAQAEQDFKHIQAEEERRFKAKLTWDDTQYLRKLGINPWL